MARQPASSRRTITGVVLVSGTGGTPVRAELRYRCDDPFAVQMVLSIGGGRSVTWTVGRDLFRAGVRQPSGLGDVHVYPVGSHVVIELGVGAHRARLIAHRPALEDFLAGTVSLVSPGSEIDHYDLDEEFHQWVPLSARDNAAGNASGVPADRLGRRLAAL